MEKIAKVQRLRALDRGYEQSIIVSAESMIFSNATARRAQPSTYFPPALMLLWKFKLLLLSLRSRCMNSRISQIRSIPAPFPRRCAVQIPPRKVWNQSCATSSGDCGGGRVVQVDADGGEERS